LGLASCAALLFSFSKKVFFVGMVLFLSGVLLYTIFGERRFRQHAHAELLGKRETPKVPAPAHALPVKPHHPRFKKKAKHRSK
jgi:hypothetical protein